MIASIGEDWARPSDGRKMPSRLLLISVKPEYAEMLLAGRKTVELRRVRPSIVGGDWVLVYASSPRKALIGAFRVKSITVASPGKLWKRFGAHAGISREDFHDYFRGAPSGAAIHVGKTIRFADPPSLSRIRESVPSFHPPQCFSYLVAGSEMHDAMLQLVPTSSQVTVG